MCFKQQISDLISSDDFNTQFLGVQLAIQNNLSISEIVTLFVNNPIGWEDVSINTRKKDYHKPFLEKDIFISLNNNGLCYLYAGQNSDPFFLDTGEHFEDIHKLSPFLEKHIIEEIKRHFPNYKTEQ